MVLFKGLHLLLTEVGRAETVLKPAMDSSREDHVVGAKLVDVLQSLHGWLIDESPAVVRELHLVIHDIIDRLIFSRCQKLFTVVFSLDQ